jgi:hypothetical protein
VAILSQGLRVLLQESPVPTDGSGQTVADRVVFAVGSAQQACKQVRHTSSRFGQDHLLGQPVDGREIAGAVFYVKGSAGL